MQNRIVQIVGVVLVLLLIGAMLFISGPDASAKVGDWSMYMGNLGHTGFNGTETMINLTTAPHLKMHWSLKASGKVTTQPIEANGKVYWGSWDGIEHATSVSTGKDVWTANLGTTPVTCTHVTHGVLSSATVASVSVGGATTSVVFVGGGNVQMYALNANTGAIIWHTALGSQPSHFLYGSPTFYKGSVYIGVASHGDCPLVQGQLVQLKADTGIIQHTFNVVPFGCTGGAVWTAPSIDSVTNIIYISTGNSGTCSSSESMADAVVALRTTDLSVVGSWRVPVSQEITDDDFGGTPTLFSIVIKGVSHQMLGLVNKNGIYYAFDRTNISAGPLWQVGVALPPGNGAGDSVSSSVWDNTNLYEAGGSATIQGTSCVGHLRAVNPANGAFLWQVCLAHDVLGTVIAVPGVVEVGVGTSFMLFNAQTGNQLFSFQDTNTNSNFLGPGSISNGVLYHGNVDGLLYAFGQ